MPATRTDPDQNPPTDSDSDPDLTRNRLQQKAWVMPAMCGFSSGAFTITLNPAGDAAMHWVLEGDDGSSSVSLYQVTLSGGSYSSDGGIRYQYSAGEKTSGFPHAGPPMAGELALSADGETLYTPSLCEATGVPDYSTPYDPTERGVDEHQQDFAASAQPLRDHHRDIFESNWIKALAELQHNGQWVSPKKRDEKRLELVTAYLADLKNDLRVLVKHYRQIGVSDAELRKELNKLMEKDRPTLRGSDEDKAVVAMYDSLL